LSIDTGVSGACILVITSENVFAFSVNALVGGTLVSITAVHWSVDASFSWNAGIGGARILVITESIVWGVSASSIFVARINCASNSIITVPWSVDDSSLSITGLDGAFVWISGWHWGVNAFSRSCITLISGTSITIVTNNWSVGASGCGTSIDGAFVVITASIIVWGESASSRSVIAIVDGTADTVIANLGVADVSC
jgi:hypothetical protein